MKKIDVIELKNDFKKYNKKEIKLAGWIKSVRSSKDFGFIDLNDGTCFKNAQIVFSVNLDNFSAVAKLNMGSSIIVDGVLEVTPEAKQPYEIKATNIEIVSATDSTYPIQKKNTSMEHLREVAYLRPRTNIFSAVYRVRSKIAFAIHKFFNEKGFVYTNTPILTSSDCEGGSDLFRVTTQNIYKEKGPFDASKDLFGKPVYLTPTGQLEGEALALAFGKIYTFGPTFRAENSNTTRHANEFWMIEPEVAFCNLDELMDLEEEMFKYLLDYYFENCKDEIDFFDSFVEKGLKEKLQAVLNSNFARVTYTDAIEILKKNNDKFEYPVSWGCDIQTEHERFLAEKTYNKPVFVTDYPKEIKAFYMKQNDDNKTVHACDLLMPGIGEVTGGSQREDDLNKLIKRMNECGLKEKDYWWYLNLRKYGSVEHSGFGIGFERFLMYITGISNIRDVLLFSRTPNNCEF